MGYLALNGVIARKRVMQVIGAGVGRTGTMSLKVALDRLGLGPCYHMDAVIDDRSGRVPGWAAALEGRPDWAAIYAGFDSAVDWPTATFFGELHVAYPQAKFLLTYRDATTWAESFMETIYTVLAGKDQVPPSVQPWAAMCEGVIARCGFPPGMDKEALARAFIAHNEAVKAAIPPAQLLVYQVKEGWEPLCAFLGVDVPDEPFPRTNDRTEFWEMLKEGGE
jgi:hypothetical protein